MQLLHIMTYETVPILFELILTFCFNHRRKRTIQMGTWRLERIP